MQNCNTMCRIFFDELVFFILTDLYNVGIEDIGFISGIPAFASFIGLIVAAFLSDYMRNNTTLSKSFVRYFVVSLISWKYIPQIITSQWSFWQAILETLISKLNLRDQNIRLKFVLYCICFIHTNHSTCY